MRLRPLLVALALVPGLAGPDPLAAQPLELAAETRLGGGRLYLQRLEEDPDRFASLAAGRRLLVVTAAYERAGDAEPLRLEAAERVFRLELDDGRLIAPHPLTREAVGGWWGEFALQPYEAVIFELVFAMPADRRPRALLAALEGDLVRLSLAAPPAGEGAVAEAPREPAAPAEAAPVAAAEPEPAEAVWRAEPGELVGAVPPVPAPPDEPRNILTLSAVVAAIEAAEGHEALIDGRRGADAPVARAALGTPIALAFTRPFRIDALRFQLRAPAGEGYRLALEVEEVDGSLRTVPLPEAGWLRGALRVELDGRPIRGLRLTALEASPGLAVLEVEEVEALSREPVPDLAFNLAWAGFGGRVIALAPAPEEPERVAFALVDGGRGEGWRLAGDNGPITAEMMAGFVDNRAFLIDAVALEGIGLEALRWVELAVATGPPDAGFTPIEQAEVVAVAEDRLLFTFQPIPARFLRLWLEAELSAGAELRLEELQVFAARGTGAAVAAALAVPGEEPDGERNLALVENGGEVAALSAGLEGEARALNDGRTDGAGVRIAAAGGEVVLDLLGDRPALVEEVRLYTSGLAWPGRIELWARETSESPFARVAARLLPPIDESWLRLVPDAPVAASELRLAFVLEGGSALELREIAVLEAKSGDRPSILEVPPEQRRPLGANVALAALGGEVVAADQEERLQGWGRERLNDGWVAGSYRGPYGSLGFTTQSPVRFPVEVTIALPRPTRLAGVGIHPGFKRRPNNDLDTDFLGDAANRPKDFEVLVSEDGERWQRVLQESLRNQALLQSFAFPNPTPARYVRIRFLANYGGDRLQLGEIELYEDPALAGSDSSLLAQGEINIARSVLGGALVSYTSQYRDAEVGYLVDGRPDTAWGPDDGWRFPQRLLLAFAGNEMADIEALELLAPEPFLARAPREIAVRASVAERPDEGFALVGRFRREAAEPVWRIDFPEPVRARFLEVAITAGFHPRYLNLAELRVIEAQRPGYRSVLVRGARAESAPGKAQLVGTEPDLSAAVAEREPNDTPAQAQIIELGQSVAGRIDPPGETDLFLLSNTAREGGLYRLRLEGWPQLRTRFALEDKGGEPLVVLEPEGTRRSFEATIALPQGSVLARVFEPPTRTVLLVDTSGSMESQMARVRRALEGFLAGMSEEEEVALVTFGGEVRTVQDFTRDVELLRSRIRELEAGGGTPLYDAMLAALDMLADHPGNRAVVLLSDGADTISERADSAAIFRRLSRSGVRLYAVALGDSMWSYEHKVGAAPARMLDFWARAGGGSALAAPTAAALAGLYGRIARDLRTGTRYRLSLVPERGRGQLRLVQTGERIRGVGTADKILFILDASGSMRGRDREGARKITTARTVFKRLVRALPDDVEVGLRVYGHRYPRRPKARSCTDSELVVPFQRIDKERLVTLVDGLRPQGQTPIGLSLRKAAQDFGDVPGRKLVVLITDGGETCAPEPEDADYPPRVVAELQEAGLDLVVNIVGFDVEKAEVRDFLARLAAQSGGRFYTADNAAELEAAIQDALRAPFEVRELTGEVVARGTIDGPPVALPAGIYRVALAAATPLVMEQVRIEDGLQTLIEINKEGEELAVDRSRRPLEEAPASLAALPTAPEALAERPQPTPSPAAPSPETAPAGGPSREAMVAALLDEAERLFRARKLTRPKEQSAFSRYRAVLALDPDNEQARLGLMRIVDTYLEWADAAAADGDFAKAERYFARALEVAPERAGLYLLRGMARMDQGRLADAEADFVRARELDPELGMASLLLGVVRLQTDRPEAALAPLAQARGIEGFDQRHEAGRLQALALYQLGRFEEAYEALVDGLTAKGDCESRPLDESCTQMWLLMATVLVQMDRADVVMDTLVEVLDFEPKGPELYDLIAALMREHGREAEAARVEALRRARFGAPGG